MRICSIVLAALAASAATAAPAAAQGAAPGSLVATSATRNTVVLAWTAADPAVARYLVERKPFGASWTPPPPPAASPIVTIPADGVTATDKSIAAFTTYVYRVRAARAAEPGVKEVLGPPSNEIIVGPPPVGFSQVKADPPGLAGSAQFARGIGLTRDANSDPAIAYTFEDPDSNADFKDSTLHFISWNRARYRWNDPVTIAVVGEIETNNPRIGICLTRDAATNQFGLAYMVGSTEVRIAVSDTGAVWKEITVARAAEGSDFGEPALALDKGRAFLAYGAEEASILFRSGLLAEPPDKWSSARAPQLPDTFATRRAGLTVSVDAAGKPVVMYWQTPMSNYSMTLAFWRPESKSVVKIADTNDFQSDSVDSRLGFAGTTVAVTFAARRDEQYFDGDHQVWFTSSADNGATWSTPVPLPIDGGHTPGPPLTMAVDSQGKPAVVSPVLGGSNGGARCGKPKLMRAQAGRWTVCSPDTKGTPTGSAMQPQLIFADNDKLYLAFKSNEEGGPLKAGVILWRER